jgi:hypothetical protein
MVALVSHHALIISQSFAGACGIPPVSCDKNLSASETDIDCGGLCEVKCEDGNMCENDSDCLSGRCTLTGNDTGRAPLKKA